jgi:hypothetical protein
MTFAGEFPAAPAAMEAQSPVTTAYYLHATTSAAASSMATCGAVTDFAIAGMYVGGRRTA